MDQGDAAVWAAGLGIAGTLAGALGGAFVQARAGRKQVLDQETVDVRHRLRDERRVAFAAILDRSGEVDTALNPIIVARVQPDWRWDENHRELWDPANAALRALQRAVTSVKITGPDDVAELAEAIHGAVLAKADALRMPGLGFDESSTMFAEANVQLESASRRFVDAARRVLAAPHW